MEAEYLQIADSLKPCIFETEPFNVKKTLKNSNHLAESGNSKHEVYREIKFKIKPLKNYMAIALILIFGLGQKIEAQTGKIDATFNPGGTGANGMILTTPIQTDGKILLGGEFTRYNNVVKNRLVRVNSNGALDVTFNIGLGFDSTINEVAIQTDNKLIAVGLFNKYNGTNRKGIVRINTDGTLDGTFNPGNGANNLVCGASLQSDGKIIICGAFNKYDNITRNRIARLNTNGTLDATFNPSPAANNRINTTAIQPDGKIIAGGAFTQFNGVNNSRIVRITSTGTVDATFVTGTGITGTSTNTAVRTAKLQSDGKILVGGLFGMYNGFSINNIVRLNTDGTRDLTFVPGTGANNAVNSITLQSDGKIIISGDFTSYDGTPSNHIARLNSDGTLDNTFKPNSGSNNSIFSTTLQSDNKLIVAGIFTSYDGVAVGSIARLLMTCSTVTAAISAQNNIPCYGLSNGSATISASGGSNFTYSWSPSGGTSSIASGLNAGTYMVVVKNDCLNSDTVTVSITERAPISLIAGASSTICSGATTSLSASASGGTGSFTYTWMPGSLIGANQTVSPTVSKTYTITVTDSNDCISSATQIVIVSGICPVSTVPCGLTINNMNATVNAANVAEAINYKFNFYDNTTNALVASKTQATRTVSFSTVSNIFYGNTYKWTVSVDIGLGFGPESNKSCAITFPPAKGTVQCGNSYSNLNLYSYSTLICKATNYRFSFYDDITNALVAVKTQTSHIIYFNTVPGLEYNKIYKWTVEVQYDNGTGNLIYGPASSNSCTIIFSTPQTTVPCGNSYTKFNTYTNIQQVGQATNYRFNFYDNITNALLATKTQTSYIIYFNTVNGLKYNKTYNWTVEVEFNDPETGILMYGPASSNSCTITFNAPETSVPCGNTYSKLNTYTFIETVDQSTNYRFNFYDNTTKELLATKTQTSHIIYFNTVTGLEYNKIYNWTVEVEYNNPNTGTLMFGPASSDSCTITFSAPQTEVPCGLSFSKLNSYSIIKPLDKATNYRFSFYDNITNALLAVKTQTSNIIYFNTVTGLEYNKTYKWTVEVEFNDPETETLMFGPASSNSCTITFNAPETTVPCGNIYTNSGAYSFSPRIYKATNYRFSFYDNATNALIATKTQTSNVIYFNTVSGLVFNNIYKWAVEVEYNDPNTQTLIYGPASSDSCTIIWGTLSDLKNGITNTNNTSARLSKQLIDKNGHEFSINLFPNPTKDKITVEASEAINNIMVYNISGQLLLSLETTNEIDLTSFKTGLYIVTIETEKNTSRFKIIKE